MIAKVLLVIAFVAVAVAVGIYCRRHTGTVDGFILGGRNVGPWMSAFAYGTSYFSAVVFVGYAGQFGFKYGISATWAGIGNAIIGSLLAWWVLGPRTREMTHRLQASTMPEFFGKRYDSRALRIAAAAIIFVFLIPYTASVYNGLSRLFGMAFALPYDVCVIGMAVVTCIYVVLGGYMATVMNDFIQGIVMLLGIIAVIVAVILNNGGFSEAIISLSQIPAEGSAMQGPFVSFFGPDLFNLLGVVILTSLGTWGLPQMVQKFYAIKTGPAIKQGAIISTIFAFVVAGGSYFLGGFGRLYEGQIEYAANGTPIYDSIIPTMLSTLPDVLIGLVIVLVLSASMSTLSSLVLTSSSTLTIDFINGNIIKNMSEKKQLVWMRGLLVVFIAISALIALFPEQIMHFFRDDAEVTRIGRQALLYACAVMPLMGYSTYVNQLYQCLGFHQAATLLASCRNGLLYVPLILLLPRMLGLPGVEMSQPGADLLTFVVSLPFQIWFFRHKLR